MSRWAVVTLAALAPLMQGAVPEYDTTCLNDQVPLLGGDHPPIVVGFTRVGFVGNDSTTVHSESFFDGAGDLLSAPPWTIAGTSTCAQATDVSYLWGFSGFDNTALEGGTMTLTLTTWARLTNNHEAACDQVDNPHVYSWNISTGAPAQLFEESASVPVGGTLDGAACENWDYAQFQTKVLAQVPFHANVEKQGCFLVKLGLFAGCSNNEVCL